MSGFAIHSERRKCKVASFAFGLSSGCAVVAETRACGYRICVWCTLRPCRTQCGCAHRRESSSESESKKKKSDYTHSLARLLLKRRGSVQSLSHSHPSHTVWRGKRERRKWKTLEKKWIGRLLCCSSEAQKKKKRKNPDSLSVSHSLSPSLSIVKERCRDSPPVRGRVVVKHFRGRSVVRRVALCDEAVRQPTAATATKQSLPTLDSPAYTEREGDSSTRKVVADTDSVLRIP